MKRIAPLALVLALTVGSQGCVGFLKKDPDGYYTNESVAAALAVPVVIAVGVGLLVYAGAHDTTRDDAVTGTLPPASPQLPEEH